MMPFSLSLFDNGFKLLGKAKNRRTSVSERDLERRLLREYEALVLEFFEARRGTWVTAKDVWDYVEGRLGGRAVFPRMVVLSLLERLVEAGIIAARKEEGEEGVLTYYVMPS